MGIKIKNVEKIKMKIQFLLLPAVLGSWWNPKTWVNTVVNKVKETVKPIVSVKSDSYAHTRLDSTSEILNTIGLDNVWLKYNVNLSPKTQHAIKWTQHNRCMVSCIENYYEFYYYEEHEEDHAFVFVYQPPENEDDREIYQKRFHMGLNDLVEKAVGALGATAGTAAGATAGATVGAAVGSIVPVAGTAIGGAIGAAMGAAGGFVGGYGATHFTNNYT